LLGAAFMSLRKAELGRYRILGCIARGGMAQIDLGCIHGSGGFRKLVVLKRLLPQWYDDPVCVQMFLDEARLGAELRHPNIVETYAVDSDGGKHFIAMELVHGVDLLTLIRRVLRDGRPMPLAHALTIVTRIASALHHAHERCSPDGAPLGLVHRDISPHNIMVSFEGAPKLIDFGIAKETLSVGQDRTRDGGIKGKLSYMSPEQLQGQRLDRRSDVFSLSIVLWELTCGHKLFSGPSDVDVFRKIAVDDPTSPRSVCPEYPPDLEAIVLKGLRRQPVDRHQSALALEVELERYAATHELVLSERELAASLRELFPELAHDPLRMLQDATRSDGGRLKTRRRIRPLHAAPLVLALVAAAFLSFARPHPLGPSLVAASMNLPAAVFAAPSVPRPVAVPPAAAPIAPVTSAAPPTVAAQRPRRPRFKLARTLWDPDSPFPPGGDR
jgi:serine/threonine protein kinase